MMLTYNGSPIEQRQDGLVNLTQMAKANDKRLDKWLENDGTREYLEALKKSISHENRGNEDIIQVKGFGADKATWGHPLVAIAFAQWISPEFHVWCNQHIKTLIQTGNTSLDDANKSLPETVMLAMSVLDSVYDKINTIRPELVGQIKLHTAENLCPALKGGFELAITTLVQATASEYRLLTPTEIGKILGKSGQAVNKLLIERNYQQINNDRKSRKDSKYAPTDKGCEFAEFTQTADGKGSTFQQLRWYESVIEQLR